VWNCSNADKCARFPLLICIFWITAALHINIKTRKNPELQLLTAETRDHNLFATG